MAGIIWALTVSESLVRLVGIALWLASRRTIARGLTGGCPERAAAVLEPAGPDLLRETSW